MRNSFIRAMFIFMLVLGALAVSAQPAYALSTIDVSIIGNPADLDAHNTYTFRTVSTNTSGSSQNLRTQNTAGVGLFFPVSLPSGCTMVWPLRRVDCTFTLAPSATKTIDFAMIPGTGWYGGFGEGLEAALYIDGGAFQDNDIEDPASGTGYQSFIWNANHTGHYYYPNHVGGSLNIEVIWQVDYAPGTTRIGKIVINADGEPTGSPAANINSMTLCKSTSGGTCTTGSIGTLTWGNPDHTWAQIQYNSWDNSYYKVVANMHGTAADGVSGITWECFSTNLGGVWYKEIDAWQTFENT